MFLVVSVSMGDVTTDDLVRLGQYVMARRAALGHRHRIELANVLPLTDRTLADIENGVRPAGAGTYAILENALQWAPGSISAIRQGGEPIPIGEPVSRLQHVTTDKLIAEIHELLDEIQGRIRSDGVVVDESQRPLPGGRIIDRTVPGKKAGVRRDQQSG